MTRAQADAILALAEGDALYGAEMAAGVQRSTLRVLERYGYVRTIHRRVGGGIWWTLTPEGRKVARGLSGRGGGA